MSNIPKLQLSLKVHNKLLKTGIQSQVVDCLVDQLRSYLGSDLARHSRDIQLIVDICRALERCPQKVDKKLACMTVLRTLFPAVIAVDEASILDLEATIDTLHSLHLFERKSVLFRAYKALFVSQKKE